MLKNNITFIHSFIYSFIQDNKMGIKDNITKGLNMKLNLNLSHFSLPRKSKKNILMFLMICFIVFSLWNNYHIIQNRFSRVLEPFGEGDQDDQDNQDDTNEKTGNKDDMDISSMNTNPYNFNDFTYKSVLKIITTMNKELIRLIGEMDKLEVDPVTTYELSEEKINVNEGNLEQYNILKNKFLQKLKERNEYVHGRYEAFGLNLSDCDDKQRYIRFLTDLDTKFSSVNQSIRRKVNRIIQIEKKGLDEIVSKLSEILPIENMFMLGIMKKSTSNENKEKLKNIKFYNSKKQMSISGKDMVLSEECN